MVSLTTVYIVSVILASVAGIGSAFAGNKMIGGYIPEPPLISQQAPSEEEQSPLPNIGQTEPEVPSEHVPRND